MEQKDFLKLVQAGFEQRYKIFDKKAHDYATEDCLSNFKRMAQMCTVLKVDMTTPEGATFFYILLKLDRLANLVNQGKTPKNESLDDNVNDLQNYIDLLRGLLHEKQQAKTSSDGWEHRHGQEHND